MRRTTKHGFFIIVALVMFLAVSCATGVTINYTQPAEINMGSYRNIAVASSVPYKGLANPPYFVRAIDADAFWDSYVTSSYDSSITTKVASYATQKFVSTLERSGFFSVTGPEKTDAMLQAGTFGYNSSEVLRKNNIDAVIIPKITNLNINEFIQSKKVQEKDYDHKDKNGNPTVVTKTRYYLYQNVSIDFSYTIIDARTSQVVAVKNFSASDSDYWEVDRYGFLTPDVYNMIKGMIDGFQGYITKQLVPTNARKNVTLMANKPKIDSLKVAYDAAKEGYTSRAAELFLREYSSSGHLPSGYNGALLTAAAGDLEGAITLLQEMSLRYSSSDVEKLLSNLITIKSRNDEAMKQLSGEVTANLSDTTMDIYQVVMGN